MKKKKKFEDDGRVVAPMNVEGMPWYQDGLGNPASQDSNRQPLSRKETIRVSFYSVLAGLSVALIFILGLLLFILFSIHVWFR